MWRGRVIRVAIALNWCVAALSWGMAVHLHNVALKMTVQRLAFVEREDRGEQAEGRDEAEWEVIYARREVYKQRTEKVYNNGLTGWWVACGASLGTAVLLMVAFPKRTE